MNQDKFWIFRGNQKSNKQQVFCIKTKIFRKKKHTKKLKCSYYAHEYCKQVRVAMLCSSSVSLRYGWTGFSIGGFEIFFNRFTITDVINQVENVVK